MAGLQPTEADVRIGARIQRARRAAGLTQRAMGAALGVSAAKLRKYEKGTNRVAAASLQTIADLTGRPIATFFDPVPDADGALPRQEDELGLILAAAARDYFARPAAEVLRPEGA